MSSYVFGHGVQSNIRFLGVSQLSKFDSIHYTMNLQFMVLIYTCFAWQSLLYHELEIDFKFFISLSFVFYALLQQAGLLPRLPEALPEVWIAYHRCLRNLAPCQLCCPVLDYLFAERCSYCLIRNCLNPGSAVYLAVPCPSGLPVFPAALCFAA